MMSPWPCLEEVIELLTKLANEGNKTLPVGDIDGAMVIGAKIHSYRDEHNEWHPYVYLELEGGEWSQLCVCRNPYNLRDRARALDEQFDADNLAYEVANAEVGEWISAVRYLLGEVVNNTVSIPGTRRIDIPLGE